AAKAVTVVPAGMATARKAELRVVTATAPTVARVAKTVVPANPASLKKNPSSQNLTCSKLDSF
ncbi:MAG: hypothetical protein J5669_04540, partial [Bacteroidales bacterium]|nr:hypothetical protein [Bacteroidales bacterium]